MDRRNLRRPAALALPRPLPWAAAALAAAAAALLARPGCGPVLFAELDQPEVRITLPSQDFPASPAPPADWCFPDRPECVATELQYQLGAEVPIVTEPGVEYELRLKRVAIVLSTSSAGDLSGIRSASIRVLDPAGGPGTVVASYEADPAAPAPTSISVAGAAALDLAPYVQGGNLEARVELVYDPSNPTPAFAADVSAAFSLDVKVDWGGYL
jgi:hypothetical protein